jgi:hypothetical protein
MIWSWLVDFFRPFFNLVGGNRASKSGTIARRSNHCESINPLGNGKIERRGDPTLLQNRDLVNFPTAEAYLGVTSRQRQKLIRQGILECRGGGQNRMITTESLRRYLPPRK